MDDQLQNQIERYLFHQMNEEEERDFILRLQSDSGLKDEVELTAMIIAATREVGEKKDLSSIDILEQASFTDIRRLAGKKKMNPVVKTLYWVATSAAVILLAVVLSHNYQQKNRVGQLFYAYYQPFGEETTFLDSRNLLRGSFIVSEKDSLWMAEGMVLYENKKYADALVRFNRISAEYADDVAVYKAVCLLETGEANQAVDLLNMAITENSERWKYYPHAQWYLALAYLKANRKKDAKSILQDIVDYKGLYAERAGELLLSL